MNGVSFTVECYGRDAAFFCWSWRVNKDGVLFRQDTTMSCWGARRQVKRALRQLEKIEALGVR